MGRFLEKCGFTFLKEGAKISGFEEHPVALNVHCPKCDSLVDPFLKIKKGGYSYKK
jgi:hypothetical protein